MSIIIILSLLKFPYGILKTINVLIIMLTKFNWYSIVIMLKVYKLLKFNWLTKNNKLIRYYTII